MDTRYVEMGQRLADQWQDRVYLCDTRMTICHGVEDYIVYAVLHSESDSHQRHNALMMIDPTRNEGIA